jgi:hypothetical protein
MTIGPAASVRLEPQHHPRRQGPVSRTRAALPAASRRAGDAAGARASDRVSAPAPAVPLGFAAQMMAYDLLFDLRPSPQPTRKLVARYRRADALLGAGPRVPGIRV